MTAFWDLGKVALKVNDLKKMTQFYQEAIGLDLLEQKENAAVLGVAADNTPLVELIQLDAPSDRKLTTGLFHLAILLPTRADLGSILYHLLTKKYAIDGASDHGYSEAIYLTDPEGNGIEIYRDKERSIWDVRPDGKIEGVTEAMDADGVIGAMVKIYDGIPSGSIMGHVHLTVHDLVETQQFYENVLGISLKSDFFGQAKFFAAGNYHHHIGSNMWAGKKLPAAEENQPGLAYFTWVVADHAAYEALKGRLNNEGISFEESANELIFKDNSGIEIHAAIHQG
ncbi:catechol 2,3-dioxygenase [Trichococcus patagoniensis]|uniref:Catechol 2,3-dioxygenase n=1 Tax=Trichococcus patagoniensis TaxID=382641 RepID=A0A2T5IFS7_9LACT|nr:VOC family protein [Trichococcus patagoniensis]PTQ82687.1 catechol 2,3-dioxygenase [Trichococcus patagoniensis]